jgi:superfamily II DNA or RNA helicase
MVVHGTGSGKSFTCANIVNDYLNSGNGKIALVIAPGGIVMNQLKDNVLEVTGPNKRTFFASYELIGDMFNPQKARSLIQLVHKYLDRMLVVCDEIHVVNDKNKGKMYTPILNLFAKAHKVVIMTATPIKNTINDLRPYAKILNPGKTITNANTSDFNCKVSVYNPAQRNGPYVPGRGNFPNLNMSEKNVNVRLSNSNERNILSKQVKTYSELRRIERNLFGNRNPKFQAFASIYEKYPGRTIVYFEEKESVKDFVHFTKNAFPAAKVETIIGGVSGAAKKKLVDNRSIDIYAVTSAAKVGADFKGIRNIVFFEYPWTASDYWQIVGRGVRTGSHNNATYTNKSVHVFNLMYRSRTGSQSRFKNEIQLNKIQVKKNLGNQVMTDLIGKSIEKCSSVSNRRKSPSPPRRRLNTPSRELTPGTFAVNRQTVYKTTTLPRPSIISRGRILDPSNWTRLSGVRAVVPAATPRKRQVTRTPRSVVPKQNASTRINAETTRIRRVLNRLRRR